MDCEEIRVDMREMTAEERAHSAQVNQLMYQLNHTMPGTPGYQDLLHQIFGDNLGEGSYIAAPIQGACIDRLKVGKRCFLNANLLVMGRGGITIEDGVQIAANTQLISNNHDPYDLSVLTCKPVRIKHDAWIGAGATILPGVCVGAHAIVGAASVVTHDVPDYAVVVGNPARVIKMLDAERFEE